jgi:hypothetical protein
MTARPLEDRDIPALVAIAKAKGYEYADLQSPHIEAVQVVEDDEGKIIAAASAERICQLYLYMPDEGSPVTKLAAMRLLHDSMATELRKLNYNEANIFLPPDVERGFGTRLRKSFGWQWNWRSMFLKF